MKVAVTGANGFIGKHVLAELEKRSVRATAIIRPSATKSRSLAQHAVVGMDLLDPPPNAFELMGEPEVLIHLGWGGLPNHKSPHHLDQELPAQYKLLKGLVDSGLTNMVVAGTCLEYGLTPGELREDMDTHPVSPYGLAKDSLRRSLESLKADESFSLTWARLFYVYGDGQAENSVLPQLRRAVERGDDTFNMSGGEQLRDFVPATEAARDLVSLAMRNKDNGIVNVCTGKPTSVRDLVEGRIRDNGWSIKLNFGYYPYPDDEPMAFWGSREKLDRCLASP